jgi:hypothetical protein
MLVSSGDGSQSGIRNNGATYSGFIYALDNLIVSIDSYTDSLISYGATKTVTIQNNTALYG